MTGATEFVALVAAGVAGRYGRCSGRRHLPRLLSRAPCRWSATVAGEPSSILLLALPAGQGRR